MNRWLLGALTAAAVATTAWADGPAAGQAPERADLDYAHPPQRSEGGLPIGNGRMGTLVWTDDHTLRLQINRVDVFGMGGASRSFPERSTDYCNGCAEVEIDFGAETSAFPEDGTTEHLACRDGVATVRAPKVQVRALAWTDDDVIALEIRSGVVSPTPLAARLKLLRPALVHTRDHTARSVLSTQADGTQVLTQSFAEGGFYCGSAVALRTTGGTGGAPVIVLISSAASFRPDAPLIADAVARLRSAESLGFGGLVAANDAWWSGFWGKSRVHLHSADGVADRVEADYAYYLYLMAATSRGEYPTKFNGMLWNTHGDERRWGAAYWGANQSCYYNNALFASDHGELMEPMFAMYSKMAPAEERAAKEEWGAQGIYFPETVTFDGLAPLPPEIAAEMPGLYLMRTPWAERSERFKRYAADMQPYTSRWNFINGGHWVGDRWDYTERGSGPYGPTSHILSRGAKIAYQYWQRYQYTMDQAWLRDRAYPIIKGVAQFYRTFPNVERGSDGLWHIHYVNSNEGLWGGRDTDEEIASMHAIFAVLIRASQILGVDAQERPQWQEFVSHLAPLPRSDLPDVFSPIKADPPVWQRSFLPVVQGRFSVLPDQNTLPTWFFDECSLESPAPVLATANATYDAFGRRPAGPRPGGPPKGKATRMRRGGVGVLSKLALAGVELGRVDAARKLIPSQMFQGETAVLENRMDLREGPQTMGVERLGDAADALHTALVADLPPAPGQDPVIRVFPAWPPEWDAEFTLVCRGNFVVSGAQRGGVIGSVRIVARSGGELVVRNPWPEALVARSDGRVERSRDRLLRFSTGVGETIELSSAQGSLLNGGQ